MRDETVVLNFCCPLKFLSFLFKENVFIKVHVNTHHTHTHIRHTSRTSYSEPFTSFIEMHLSEGPYSSNFLLYLLDGFNRHYQASVHFPAVLARR